MPAWSMWLRPEWTLMVLIYWALALPQQCGVLLAAMTGLILDSLSGIILGKQMLIFALIVALVILIHRRFRMYDLWHQARVVLALALFAQLLLYCLDHLTNTPTHFGFIFLPPMISALIWPWIMIVLRGIRRYFGITTKFAIND